MMIVRAVVWAGVALVVCVILWFAIAAPGASYKGAPGPLSAAERESEGRLRQLVAVLASHERDLEHPEGLEAAAAAIEATLLSQGQRPLAQRYRVGKSEVRNIEVEIAGGAQREQIVLVGAHYDASPGTPGADANASGAAALLELARLLRDARPQKTLRLVWFVNREKPYFMTPDMGSVRYLKRAISRGERIVAMYSLEAVGFYTDAPGSQRYPEPLGLFYPSTGDFVAFVGNLDSRALVHGSIAAFRGVAKVASEAIAAPSFTPDIDQSDHAPFWQQGIPAVMVTDTFRYRRAKSDEDTPDRLDYPRFARVVAGLRGMLAGVAGERSTPGK